MGSGYRCGMWNISRRRGSIQIWRRWSGPMEWISVLMCFAGADVGRMLLGSFGLVQRRAEQGPRPLLILRLRFVFGHLESDARRLMEKLPARFHLVHILPARPTASTTGFLDVLGIDIDLH